MTTLPKVCLRPQTLEDADLVVRWRSDPVVQSQLFSERAPTLKEHGRWFAGLGENRKELIILAEGQLPIGTAGLSRIDRDNASAEYGILIGERNYRGRGYATAASGELFRIAFEELRLKRLYLRVFEDNERAICLYLKLGFQRESVVCEPVWKKGVWRNVISMGITADQWQSPA